GVQCLRIGCVVARTHTRGVNRRISPLIMVSSSVHLTGGSMDAATRPMRADARRNYERILECARQTFAELGTEAPLDEIARRTGVGPGTLYRHFPNRAALIEAVYRSSIEALSRRAAELLDADHTPLEALDLWVRAQVDFVMNRRGLAVTLKAALDRDS